MEELNQEEHNIILDIFYPEMVKAQGDFQDNGRRFVHYTSAEAALNILKSKEVWLRNTTTMNDYSEVEHGLFCLAQAYNSEEGEALRKTLDDLYPNLTKKLQDLFNGWQPFFKNDSFIFCISEHEDYEDETGRLSMWRAYGQGSGVALVLNNYPFLQEVDELTAYTSKVEYLNKDDFSKALKRMKEGIDKNKNLISMIGEDWLLKLVFDAFKYAALSSKHKGFREEQEWRVIYNPVSDPSEHIEKKIVTIRGIPQEIHCIKLKNKPEIKLTGVEIPELINRVIIGPSIAAQSIKKAFVSVLTDAGMPDAKDRVFISDIPLR